MNVDPAESDLSHLDPQEIVVAVTSVDGQRQPGSDFGTATPQDQESRQKVWWYLLLGALFLMARRDGDVESTVAGFVDLRTEDQRRHQWKAYHGLPSEQSQLLGVVRGVRNRYRAKRALRGAAITVAASWAVLVAAAYVMSVLKYSDAAVLWRRIVRDRRDRRRSSIRFVVRPLLPEVRRRPGRALSRGAREESRARRVITAVEMQNVRRAQRRRRCARRRSSTD